MSVGETPTVPAKDPEARFLLEGVPWETYVALRDAVDGPGLRMTYLEGRLELVTTSRTHEEEKSIIARLVETWAVEQDVDLRAFGGPTFREQAVSRGLEPDECYSLGPLEEDEVPHLCLEVVVSNPLLDKLAVYAGLGISEVWVWHSSERRLCIHHLVDGTYVEADRSSIVPELDLEQLVSFIETGKSQTAMLKAYRAALQAKG